jgi:hypothetical protein
MLLSLAGMAAAQDWAKKMFSETNHDFGKVPRGAKTEYKFTIENIYEEEAHISACFSSCECTKPQIDKQFLKTWEKAELTAVVDTKNYFGQRDVTITVKFDAPFPAEVQVHIHAYIRSDVVVQPEEVQFGTVKLGSVLQRQAVIKYAGPTNPTNWQIVRVESANPYLQAQIVETSRVGNKVTYDLITTLKGDAPVGYIKDTLFLITNDTVKQSARLPVPVEAIVAPPLAVQPNPLLLGVLKKDQPATKQLVIRSTAAVPAQFHITAAKCDDPRFEVTLPSEAKNLHLLPVTFKGSKEPGRIAAKLRLETDLPNVEPVEVILNVQVTP